MKNDDDFLTNYQPPKRVNSRSTVIREKEQPQPIAASPGKETGNKHKKTTALLSAAALCIVGGIAAFLLFNRQPEFIDVRAVPANGKTLLVELAGDYSYSKSGGKELVGYVLLLADAETKQEISRLPIDAGSEADEGAPLLKVYGADNIWLVKLPANSAGSTGIIRHYAIDGNAVHEIAEPDFSRYTPLRFTSENHLTVGDDYSEVHCLDLFRHVFSDDECPYISASDTAHAAFFKVVKDQGATRCRLFHYAGTGTDSGAANAGGQLGFEVLAMNAQQLTETDLGFFEQPFEETDGLLAIDNGNYFYNLQFVVRTPAYAIVSHTMDNESTRYYSCYAANGKLLWKVTHDVLQGNDPYRLDAHCETVNGLMYVMLPYFCSFAVELDSRALRWVYHDGKFAE